MFTAILLAIAADLSASSGPGVVRYCIVAAIWILASLLCCVASYKWGYRDGVLAGIFVGRHYDKFPNETEKHFATASFILKEFRRNVQEAGLPW